MMNAEHKKRFIADMEAQGATARETKKGIIIFAPNKNDMRTISAISGDVKGLRDDIAWFRRHGLTHPADKKLDQKKEQPEMARTTAATNEEGYPLYLTGPITSTTRERVLSELEAKGWPLEVLATDLSMDTTSAAKALYAVGYRWGEDGMEGKKNRRWHAPDEIARLHTLARQEAERRESEAREARIAAAKEHTEKMAGHEGVEDHPMQVVKTDSVLTAVQEARTKPLPSLDFVKHVGHAGEHHPVLNPEVHGEPPLRGDLAEPIPTADIVPNEPPAREFVDDVDSWVVDAGSLPGPVGDYLNVLRSAGLEAEIRVWRKQ